MDGSAEHQLLRRLPSVEKLIHATAGAVDLPREMTARLVREEVAALREAALGGVSPPEFEQIATALRDRLAALARSRQQPVINATGVLLHTNLGRAPLSAAVADAVRAAACDYSNLELDMDSGERGRRGAFVENALAVLTGAESATVTNNCAAALVLMLRHLTSGGKAEAIIARGQLIEIGGGFRIPEIMETSGTRLREVGATNRVTLADYEKAIGPETAMILRVHRSNFSMEGFVSEPDTAELAMLARAHWLPLVEDLGSGAVVATESLAPLEHEPTPQERLAAGADLVCFSGDKLFGGPQAGIICGRAELIAGIKRDPLFRALRCDKLILAALEATVMEYLSGSTPALPLCEMLATPLAALEARARAIVQALSDLRLAAAAGQSTARCGGGTMPRSSLPSITVDLRPSGQTADGFARRLRQGSPPVAGYIVDGMLRLDLRTVFPRQDDALTSAIRAAASPLAE